MRHTFQYDSGLALLSVIVPVYKVEDTLDRCVSSILRQDYPRMEIILIDDGSPDSCPQKCDEWAERDPRICVIHQQNKGLSGARNAGLDMAQGEFITFVDSDDMLADNTYGELMTLIQVYENADVLEFAARVDVGTKRVRALPIPNRTYDFAEEYWFITRAYLHCYAWNKLYRSCLFDDIRFPEGKVFEDVYTWPRLMRKARQIYTTVNGTYLYYGNPNGISRQPTEEHLRDFFDAHMLQLPRMLETYRSFDVPRRQMSEYYIHVFNIQVMLLRVANQYVALPRFRTSLVFNCGLSTFVKSVMLMLMPSRWTSSLVAFLKPCWKRNRN